MTEKEAECLIDGLNVVINGLRDILSLKSENEKLKEELSTVETEIEELKDQNRKLTNGVNYWIEKYKNAKEEHKKLQAEINELKACEICVHFGKKVYENDPFLCPYVCLCSNKDHWRNK